MTPPPLARILVVDDEPQIHRFLKPALIANQFEALSAGSVAEALRCAANDAPDLVILDLGLPDGDGRDAIPQLRQWSDAPIIVLSARNREADKVAALDLGADDFVDKPFHVSELMARIRAALRRRLKAEGAAPLLRLGDLTIDLARRQIARAGAEIRLTPKEFELLKLLALNLGRVVTHRQLLTGVWGPAHAEDAPYLRVHIGQLRRKIEPTPEDPSLIVTEPGVGYRLREVGADSPPS